MTVRTIEAESLVAGTMYRGQFEEKLERLVREIRARSDVILFIDEMHTLIGAGRAEGVVADAADMLKPVLSEGTIKVIGATTTDEFRKHIESDKALMRRFQQVVVGEPTREATMSILEGLVPRYEGVPRRVNPRSGTLRPASTCRCATCTAATCRTRRSTYSTGRAPRRSSSSA